MNYISLFHTPLYIGEVTEDLSDLVSKCQSEREKSPGKVMSNKGGWQSNDFDGKEIESYVKDQLNEVAQNWGIRGLLSPSNCWYNINTSQNYNLQHDHPGSILSGVLYLKCPENTGPIVFLNPVSSLINSYIEPYVDYDVSHELASSFTICPNQGSLLIFPSWLGHRVDAADYEGERISLSFNTKVEIPSIRDHDTL